MRIKIYAKTMTDYIDYCKKHNKPVLDLIVTDTDNYFEVMGVPENV